MKSAAKVVLKATHLHVDLDTKQKQIVLFSPNLSGSGMLRPAKFSQVGLSSQRINGPGSKVNCLSLWPLRGLAGLSGLTSCTSWDTEVSPPKLHELAATFVISTSSVCTHWPGRRVSFPISVRSNIKWCALFSSSLCVCVCVCVCVCAQKVGFLWCKDSRNCCMGRYDTAASYRAARLSWFIDIFVARTV